MGQIDKEMAEPFMAGMEPLCGWPWIEANKSKVYPEQGMTVSFDGKVLLSLQAKAKPSLIRAAIRMAVRSVKGQE